MFSNRDEKIRLLIIALILASLEIVIPKIPLFPWLKPGFANAITLIWLIRYGTKDALLFGFLRTWIVSLYFGLSFITFVLASSGMIASVLCMTLLKKSKFFGLIGISIAGAFFHSLSQMIVLKPLLSSFFSIENQLPVMSIAAVVTGSLTAFLASTIIKHEKIKKEHIEPLLSESSLLPISPIHKSSLIILLTMAVALFFVHSYTVIAILFISSILIAISHSSLKVIAKRVWGVRFFLFVIFLSFLPWRGNEELAIASLHSVRIIIWLVLSLSLQHFGIDSLLFSFLQKVFPHKGDTLAAGLFVAQNFPLVIESTTSLKKGGLIPLLKSPFLFVDKMVETSEWVIDKAKNEKP